MIRMCSTRRHGVCGSPRGLAPSHRIGQDGDRPLEVEVGVATTQQDQLLPEPIELVPASRMRSPSRRQGMRSARE
jgi:hypothetical protein